MEKLLYLQNLLSLAATFDEPNVELEILNNRPRFLILTETWLRECSNFNITWQDRWKSIEKFHRKLKGADVWQFLGLKKYLLLPSEKLLTNIYRFELLKRMSRNGKNFRLL